MIVEWFEVSVLQAFSKTGAGALAQRKWILPKEEFW
jgi:hypothetical protein